MDKGANGVKAIVEGEVDAPCCVDLWKELSQQSEQHWTWGWLWFLERIQWSADRALQLRNQGILYQLPVSDLESLNNLHPCRQGGEPQRGDASCSEGSFHKLTVATINVLSLFAGSDGSLHAGNYTSARMEAIATPCRQHGLDIVGLQETRHKADHYFETSDFHVLARAANRRRSGGTQLWVAKDAFGLQVEHRRLKTLYATDRILLAELSHPSLHIGLLVLHAPSSEDATTLQEWWNEVDSHLRQLNDVPFLVMMDANSRVGSTTSCHIGDHDAAPKNHAGEALHGWSAKHSLWLPSTFRLFHTGTSYTWHHSTGPGARLDYVAIPLQFYSQCKRSWVEDDIDIQTARVDHLATCLEFELWETDAPQDAVLPPVLRKITPHSSGNDEIAWPVDVNTHADMLEERASAIQKVQRRRKVHLRDATWQLIQAKKCCWKNLKAVRQHRSRGMLGEIFMRWRWQSSHAPDTFQPWLRWTDFEEARLMFLLRRFTREGTAAVRADDLAYYEDLAVRAGTVDGEGGLKELWREIKATLPKALLRKRPNNLGMRNCAITLISLKPERPLRFQHWSVSVLRCNKVAGRLVSNVSP